MGNFKCDILMEKQITISDTYGISKEWIEEQDNCTEEYLDSDLILGHEVEGVRNLLYFIRIVKSQLFPIEPIVKDLMEESYSVGIGSSNKSEQEILSQPITIKL
jgi:hypothetical protein